MKKRKKGRKLSRKTDQRKSLLKSVAREFFLKEKIKTTEAKAKEARGFIEKKISRAKIGDLNSRKQRAKDFSPQIAILLRGKQKPDFFPYKDMGDFVIIKNVDKIKLTGKKAEQKIYYHHTGYLGGLEETPFKKLFKERPGEVL